MASRSPLAWGAKALRTAGSTGLGIVHGVFGRRFCCGVFAFAAFFVIVRRGIVNPLPWPFRISDETGCTRAWRARHILLLSATPQGRPQDSSWSGASAG